jgi:hypothetical protein
MAAFSRFSSAFAPSAPGNAQAEPPRTRDTRQLDSAACPVDGEAWNGPNSCRTSSYATPGLYRP